MADAAYTDSDVGWIAGAMREWGKKSESFSYDVLARIALDGVFGAGGILYSSSARVSAVPADTERDEVLELLARIGCAGEQFGDKAKVFRFIESLSPRSTTQTPNEHERKCIERCLLAIRQVDVANSVRSRIPDLDVSAYEIDVALAWLNAVPVSGEVEPKSADVEAKCPLCAVEGETFGPPCEKHEAEIEALTANVLARARPTNAQHEPPYPGAETVAFSLSAPDLTAHRVTARCGREEPHPIANCGEFDVPASSPASAVPVSEAAPRKVVGTIYEGGPLEPNVEGIEWSEAEPPVISEREKLVYSTAALYDGARIGPLPPSEAEPPQGRNEICAKCGLEWWRHLYGRCQGSTTFTPSGSTAEPPTPDIAELGVLLAVDDALTRSGSTAEPPQFKCGRCDWLGPAKDLSFDDELPDMLCCPKCGYEDVAPSTAESEQPIQPRECWDKPYPDQPTPTPGGEFGQEEIEARLQAQAAESEQPTAQDIADVMNAFSLDELLGSESEQPPIEAVLHNLGQHEWDLARSGVSGAPLTPEDAAASVGALRTQIETLGATLNGLADLEIATRGELDTARNSLDGIARFVFAQVRADPLSHESEQPTDEDFAYLPGPDDIHGYARMLEGMLARSRSSLETAQTEIARFKNEEQNFGPWKCFHCGEVFDTVGGARDHFGATEGAEPGCFIKVQYGEERGLQMELRKAEAEVARLRLEVTTMDEDTAAYHGEQRELARLFGEGVRTAHQAWLKLEAKDGAIEAVSERLETAQADYRICATWADETNARLDSALKALEPFAEIHDRSEIEPSDNGVVTVSIRVGHLRAAALVLEQPR